METFGRHLLQFAHSVDIVSESVLTKTRSMISDYLKKSLGIEFWEILVPIKINGKNGLKSEWSEEGANWAHTIKDSEGKYNGQISYAWDKQRNTMWIVSASAFKNLASADGYVDLLHPNDSREIPQYVDLTDAQIKTSIISMLPHDKNHIGVLNLESTNYLKPSTVLKKEVEHIRIAIGLLMGLYKTNIIQNHTTNKAIDALGEFKTLPLSINPRAFFSYSNKAPKDVVHIINAAFQPYDIELQDWQRDYSSGSIPDQIWDNISNSEIGICYLSEPAENGSNFGFQDNYNVIFETGMMHCLTKLRRMHKYILVRESSSPNPPFNFTTEKIVFIPRGKDGKLDKEEFLSMLQQTLSQLHLPKK
jgi:hypothetical protein